MIPYQRGLDQGFSWVQIHKQEGIEGLQWYNPKVLQGSCVEFHRSNLPQ